VISIAQEKATGVRGVLVDSISARILRKESCSLGANFLPVSFLGIAPEAVTRIPRIAATTSFRIMFFLLPCWISLPNDKTNSTKQLWPTTRSPTESCRYELDSVTMPRADNAVRAGETQKAQEPQ